MPRTTLLRRSFGAKAGWLNLNRISRAFITRALTFLSLSALLLSSLDDAPVLATLAGWKPQVLLLGGLTFLGGYLVIGVSAPAEFQGRSDIIRIVADMILLNTDSFFSKRRDMLKKLTAQFRRRCPFDLVPGVLEFAEAELKKATRESAADLYEADIQLLQFVKPRIRLTALLLLLAGIVLMAVPTVSNVIGALLHLRLAGST